jgi:hypothetical protein
MNFSQQTESATDQIKYESYPSLKLRAELLLTWLKDVGEVDEDTTLEDVIFVGDFYDLDRFSVEGTEYSVGDEDEVRKSCEESIRDQIYSEGLQVFNKDFLKSHIDEKDVKRYAEEFLTKIYTTILKHISRIVKECCQENKENNLIFYS